MTQWRIWLWKPDTGWIEPVSTYVRGVPPSPGATFDTREDAQAMAEIVADGWQLPEPDFRILPANERPRQESAEDERPHRRWRLLPELVPLPLWGVSACNLLPKASWRNIRGRRLLALDSTCSVCSAQQDKGMVCHEVWHYDDAEHSAQLVGLTILCPSCNFVHHMGRAAQIGQQDRAIAHMIAVNGMTAREAHRQIGSAFQEWHGRSKHAWSVCVAPQLLEEFPDLAILDELRTFEPRVRPDGAAPKLTA